jgi:hypothetical membrane protein
MATPVRERVDDATRAVAPRDLLGRVRGPAVAVVTVLAPVVLVIGGLIAEAAQPPRSYDPVGQTVSVLAGRGATDRWIMTAVLAALGVIYLFVAAALREVPRTARLVLGVGASAVVVAALAAQPVHGSSTVHMAGTVTGVVTFVVWPVALAADRRVHPGLRRGSVVATGLMLVALGWVCAQGWTHGTWLGVAERVLLLVETVWPIRVALASWPGRRLRVEWTTLALALLGPVVLVVGFVAAQAAQPGPDPWNRSLSALSGQGASSRWIMVSALGAAGVLVVLVALGLRRRVPPAAWRLLAAGGVFLVVAGLDPQPVGGYSTVHMLTAGLAWAAFTAWPLALAFSPRVDHRLRWASAIATAVLVVLVAWFTAQLVTGGTWYGVSQRVVILAQAVWPVVVAATPTARAASVDAAVRRGPSPGRPR